MAFSIEEFKGAMKGGGAVPSHFSVQVTNKINPLGDLKLAFTCRAAQLPGFTIGEVQLPYFGRKIKLKGERPAFDPWTVTIINDEDFLVRNALETWSSAMNGHETNLVGAGVTADPASYKSTANVFQYSKDGSIIKQYNFVGLWPSVVSPIDLDWSVENTIEEFQVTFSYDYWLTVGLVG